VYLTLILGDAERVLWLVVYTAQLLLLARLAQQRLLRRYRFFALYLGVQVVEASLLLALKTGTNAYGWTYAAFVPVIGLCATLAVLELHELVLRDYAGIRSLARWMISGSLAVALVVAALTLSPDLSNPGEPYPLIRAFHVFQRVLYSALFLFMLFVTAFLLWFPLPLNRNIVLHTVVFLVSFAGRSGTLLLRNVGGAELRLLASTLNLGITATCLLSWILFLTRAGEQKLVVSGHRWRPSEADRLVEQLDSINSTLLRTAQKR
jgi:hypothetical protein